MYQLTVTVHEYPSVWRVLFAFSVVKPSGSVRALGTREVWIEVPDPSGDALVDALEVVKRAATLELRPNR
jgi:hypothetical protein